MKTLYIVFSRIKQHFISNKVIFCFFLIGCFSCSITLIYFYGNMITIKANSANNNANYRTYQIQLSQPVSTKQIDFGKLNRFNVEHVEENSLIAQKDLLCDNIGPTFVRNTKSGFYVSTFLAKQDTVPSVANRTSFTKEELNQGKDVIVLPDNLLKDNNIPVSLIICNHKYQIIGIGIQETKFYIPSTLFEKNMFKVNNISVLLVNRLSSKQDASFLEVLNNLFPRSHVTGPSAAIQSEEQRMPKEIVTVSIIYFISLLSFMFLMKFLIDINSGKDIIYSLVGAKKKYVMKIITLENVVINLIIGLFGIAFHVILKNVLFDQINVVSGIKYNALDYIIILAIMLIITVVIQIPFNITYYRHSLISLKNEYVMEA